jgi:hypothetical protein
MGAMNRPVLRQITRWKSARFRVGAIVSSPIPSITERHSLFPSSFTCCAFGPPLQLVLVCRISQTAHQAYLVPYKQRDWEGSAFSPVIPTSACLHQASRQPITSSLLPLHGSSSLTTFNSSSRYINHPIQPGTSSGRNYRTHGKLLAEFAAPRRAVTLSERSRTPPLPVTHRS